MGALNFTAAYHKEIKDKISVFRRLITVFKELEISRFSDSINEITVIFQARHPKSNTEPAKERKVMRRKTKTLELYLVLDYERIMSGTHDDNLAYMKEVFIKGCENFLKPMKGFDYTKFYTDAEKFLKPD